MDARGKSALCLRGLLVMLFSAFFVVPSWSASLHGVVIEDGSGTPLDEARIEVEALSKGCPAGSSATGEDGKFHVKVDSGGRCRVKIVKSGYAPGVWIVPVENDTNLVVRLRRLGVVSGAVRTDAGVPVRQAAVQLFATVPGSDTPHRFKPASDAMIAVSTDDRGLYRLFGVPAGSYVVTAVGPSATIIPGSGRLVVSLAAPAHSIKIENGEDIPNVDFTLSGVVGRSLDGRIQPLPPGNSAVVLTLSPRETPTVPAVSVRVGDDGHFHFDLVPAGAYTLFAAGPVLGLSGIGGPLGQSPFFGREDVDFSGEAQDPVSVSMHGGRASAFELVGNNAESGSACARAGIVHLTALGGLGQRMDRVLSVGAGVPTEIADLAPIRYAVAVSGLPDGCYYAGDPIVDMSVDDRKVIALRVAPCASFHALVPPAGKGHSGPRVVMISPAAGEWRNARPATTMCLTDSNGRFEADALPPGHYRILAVTGEDWADLRGWPGLSAAMEIELLSGVRTNAEIPITHDESRVVH